jgi:Type IV secretion-system coupling protein DNA-binding domain
MEARRETSNGSNKWFHLHWPREDRLFNGPKIVSPQMAAVSNAIGKVEIERMKETRFDGSRSGRNFAIDRQIEPLVMDSEISGLENRHAFLKLGNNVARFHFE